MAVSTEKIIPGVLPPKEETAGVDFLSILDSFDPASLSASQLEKFKPRDPYVTGYQKKGEKPKTYLVDGKTYPLPNEPAKERAEHGSFSARFDREDLASWQKRYNAGEEGIYGKTRASLVKAIGTKACAYIAKAEYDAMTPEERKKDQENWDRWSKYWDEEKNRSLDDEGVDDEGVEDAEHEAEFFWSYTPYGYVPNGNWKSDNDYISILAVKVADVRKKLKINQREFAKMIGVNINKYGDYERGNLELEDLGLLPDEFLKRIVDATYANPYWLEDIGEDSVYNVDEEKTAKTVEEAENYISIDPYAMFADASVIRHWWSRKKMK